MINLEKELQTQLVAKTRPAMFQSRTGTRVKVELCMLCTILKRWSRLNGLFWEINPDSAVWSFQKVIAFICVSGGEICENTIWQIPVAPCAFTRATIVRSMLYAPD